MAPNPSSAQRIAILIAATALIVLSASMAWAAVNDFGARIRVPIGVTIAGTDLSGMTEPDARAAIEKAVSAPLMRPVQVNAGEQAYRFDPNGSVTLDVDAMVIEAFAPRRSAAYLDRVVHDVTGSPMTAEIEPRYSVDARVLSDWVDGLAAEIDTPAVDASITVSGSDVRIQRSAVGLRIERAQGAAALAAAFATQAVLADDRQVVEVPVTEIQPDVADGDLGKTIVVDLSDRRIQLFKGVRLEKRYRCAIGTPSHPTPTGRFHVVEKRRWPTWVNPAPTGWGKGMPPMIAPGLGNPLGTRAINLSASGIRFHGTNKIWSVGTAASHGCMRMVRSDIEDMFERVPVGTPVYIVP